MDVVSLRRYPVKSMGGESLDVVRIDGRGLAGDRWYAVEDDQGRFASGKDSRRFRRRDRVFDYTAATTSGVVVVSGPGGTWQVGDASLDAHLSQVMGAAVRVAPEGDVSHQDGAQISLVGTATLDWCADRWGILADPRRLRVNLVVRTTEAFVEEGWVGHELMIGSTVLGLTEQVERCRTVDVDQDGAIADGRWLKPLAAERDLCVAVYAEVRTPGSIQVGDAVVVG